MYHTTCVVLSIVNKWILVTSLCELYKPFFFFYKKVTFYVNFVTLDYDIKQQFQYT